MRLLFWRCVPSRQGIPFFYRWLVERYPLCSVPVSHGVPLPPIDNLLLDMNGIIHQASHIDAGCTLHGARCSFEIPAATLCRPARTNGTRSAYCLLYFSHI